MSASVGELARRPARKVAVLVAVATTLVLLCCGGGLTALLFDTLAGEEPASAAGCGERGRVSPNGKLPSIRSLNEDQIRNAAIIIDVGATMQLPPRGWVIAVATALQESYLRNLGDLGPRNDNDSLGLFQQRPSQGWGTPAQVMDPAYASRKFYEKLVKVPRWQLMSLTDAAQAVQQSAYPDAYAKHEPLAASIVDTLANGAARAAGSITQLRCAGAGEISASGWTAPVLGSIVSGFRTAGRPTHNGVDIDARPGTDIRVAAAGVVLVSRCDAARTASGALYTCAAAGSPSIKGCGWYVDVLHAGKFITRYCHMIQRPFVVVGQRVAAGDIIGKVGSTGNSSGPHLHFETHINGDRSGAGAVNPVGFMRERGITLGTPK